MHYLYAHFKLNSIRTKKLIFKYGNIFIRLKWVSFIRWVSIRVTPASLLVIFSFYIKFSELNWRPQTFRNKAFEDFKQSRYKFI